MKELESKPLPANKRQLLDAENYGVFRLQEKYKCVLSVRVANELLAKNYELVTIEPSNRFPGKLVFVFKNSPELEAEFKKFKRKG